MTAEMLKKYFPEKDAPKEREITETFIDGLSEHAFKCVRDALILLFDYEGQEIWSHLIYLYPMIERVAIYTYCPNFEERKILLGRWIENDEKKGDYRNSQANHDAAFLISLAKHPELSDKSISIGLKGMYEEFSCVYQADVRKLAGHPDSIKKLRSEWKRFEPFEHGNKIIIDRFPFYKVEHLDMPNKVEIHYEILDDTNTDEVFINADSHLVEMFQWFNKNQIVSKDTKVFVYGNDEQLADPPGNHHNPFSFDLLEKYTELVNTVTEEAQKRWPEYDVTLGDVATTLLEKVVAEWKGDRPPTTHFSKVLPWRVKDVLRQEKKKIEKNVSLDDENEKSLSAQQEASCEEKHNDLKSRLRTRIDMLAQESTNFTERLILQIQRRVVDSDGEEDIPTDQEIANKLKNEHGKSVSRQYIQKVRTKICDRLKQDLTD